MRRFVELSAAIGVVVIFAVAGTPAASFGADSVTISLGGTEFLPGQRLTFNGFTLNRTTAVDIYMGIALPGNGGIAFFDAAARVTVVPGLEAPGSIPRLAAFPGSPLMNFPAVYFPTTGLEDGTYDLQLFVASVVARSLQDNVFNPRELLAIDVRPITLTYSREPRFEFEASVSGVQRTLIGGAVSQTQDFLAFLGAPDFGSVTISVAETLEGVGAGVLEMVSHLAAGGDTAKGLHYWRGRPWIRLFESARCQ